MRHGATLLTTTNVVIAMINAKWVSDQRCVWRCYASTIASWNNGRLPVKFESSDDEKSDRSPERARRDRLCGEIRTSAVSLSLFAYALFQEDVGTRSDRAKTAIRVLYFAPRIAFGTAEMTRLDFRPRKVPQLDVP